MPTLHLGVVEQPYGNPGAKTTGDIAEILEGKYGLFSVFVGLHEPLIAREVENSLQGALESLFMGRRPNIGRIRSNAFQGAMGAIEEAFRDAIDAQAYDGIISGVPTKAALMGVRHSWKRPHKRTGRRYRKVEYGDPRASFFDTGLLSSSFRAWID